MVLCASTPAKCHSQATMGRGDTPWFGRQLNSRAHDAEAASVHVCQVHAESGDHRKDLLLFPPCGPSRPLEAARATTFTSTEKACLRMRDHLQRAAPLVPQPAPERYSQLVRVQVLPRRPWRARQGGPDVDGCIGVDESKSLCKTVRPVEARGDSEQRTSTGRGGSSEGRVRRAAELKEGSSRAANGLRLRSNMRSCGDDAAQRLQKKPGGPTTIRFVTVEATSSSPSHGEDYTLS